MARILVIGDIHGCLEEFRALLDKLSFTCGTDRLILLGDLMDRGPDPVGCVRLARELGVESVMSNHEEKAIRWAKHEATRKATGKKNPMKPFPPERAAQHAALNDDDIAWFKSLPFVLEVVPGLLAVHAGMEPAFKASEQTAAVIRVRYVDTSGKMVGFSKGTLDQPPETVYWTEQWKGPESIVYGHAVHSLTEPRIDTFPGGQCFGIDTGACFGGRLTAMVVEDGKPHEFVQVQAKREYVPPRVNSED
jgi:hypothetical protein